MQDAVTEVPRPLHRLTPLRDDPMAVWLPRTGKRSVALAGWLVWLGFSLTICVLATFVPLVLGLFGLVFFRIIRMGFVFLGAVLTPFVLRRVVVKVKNNKMQELVRERVGREALQRDDWSALEAEPDGSLVSLVGWARARERLASPICGERCIGVALACAQSYPGVLESLHDFELVDEQGRAVPISVAGGRLLGSPNVRVFGDDEGRKLVASLDLPVGAVAGDALALRDGDPLMVVGFKTSTIDPSAPGMRTTPVRVTLASSSSRPLLIYTIVAERNPSVKRASREL